MTLESVMTKMLTAYYTAVLKVEDEIGETAYTRGLKEGYKDALNLSIRMDYERMRFNST